MRLIDADALEDKYNSYPGEINCEIYDMLHMAKTIEPVCGEWDKDKDTIKCSKCGFGMFPDNYYFKNSDCFSANDPNYRPNFCPNCGAKMGNSNG